MLGGVAAAGEAPEGIPVTVHSVEQGETLWALASGINPGKDNRDVVFEIMRLNGMSDGSLKAGQTLLLPSY
jgi:LysM repeat protein